MNKISIYLLLLLPWLSANGQSAPVAETLAKVEAYYQSQEAYHIEMEYKMYRGYTGDRVTEAYAGTMSKIGEVVHVKILGSEIIRFPKVKLTINDENKMIIYESISAGVAQETPVAVADFLKFFKETDARISGNMIVYEMTPKNPQMPMPYAKLVLHVNKDNYQMEKQVLYMAEKVPFADVNGQETLDTARMVITLKTKDKSPKNPELEDYVMVGADNKLRAVKAYAGYNLTVVP